MLALLSPFESGALLARFTFLHTLFYFLKSGNVLELFIVYNREDDESSVYSHLSMLDGGLTSNLYETSSSVAPVPEDNALIYDPRQVYFEAAISLNSGAFFRQPFEIV